MAKSPGPKYQSSGDQSKAVENENLDEDVNTSTSIASPYFIRSAHRRRHQASHAGQENIKEDVEDNVKEDIEEDVEEDVEKNIEEDIEQNIKKNIEEDVEEDIEEKNLDEDVNMFTSIATPYSIRSAHRRRHQASHAGQEDVEEDVEEENFAVEECELASISSRKKPTYSQRRSASHPASIFSVTWIWLQDVLGRTLTILKTPISYVLVILVVFAMAKAIAAFMVATVCNTPILASTLFCPLNATFGSPDFGRLVSLQSQMEDVQAISAAGVSLPMTIKRGEASVRELAMLVSGSDLPSRSVH
jgi:hypothetical protein